MSAKAIREYDGKLVIAYWLLRSPLLAPQELPQSFIPPTRVALISFDTSILHDVNNNNPALAFNSHVTRTLSILERTHPWLLTEKLVVKPDQLIKRRGKSGLLLLNTDWKEVKQWVMERAGKTITVKIEEMKK